MTAARFLTGQLLLAMPGMGDPRFDHAVIALAVHDAEGALGIGIGHAVAGMTFHDMLDNVGIERGAAPDAPVHYGGPVEPHRGFVLHSPDWCDSETIAVDERLALSASLDVLRAIAGGGGPMRWLFALGYAGWGAGQLDGEMRRHGWFAAPADDAIVFETAAEKRWTAVWRAAGIDPAMLASTTGRA
ncbi:MAG TPA: YqgE/AlgH family protein [Novosphingobium sp.]|nr:YqgE/AlgH family protein [Novosphingobium sp.]